MLVRNDFFHFHCVFGFGPEGGFGNFSANIKCTVARHIETKTTRKRARKGAYQMQIPAIVNEKLPNFARQTYNVSCCLLNAIVCLINIL